jgi:hypothetical protein
MTVKLMSRDRELISSLDSQINILSFEQVARGWWGRTEDIKGSVSRRLRTLAKDGHLHVFEAVCGPEFEFSGPLLEWTQGAPLPNTDGLLDVAARRAASPTSKHRFVASSRAKAALVANGPPELATHELNLAALFLRLRDEVDGWRVVPGAIDSQFSAALDSSGRRYEIARRPISDKVVEVVGRCQEGLEVW